MQKRWIFLLMTLSLAGAQELRVSTTAGSVVGQQQGAVRVWEGIPYAEPPVGELRWQPPRPKTAWVGDWQAVKAGPVCAQSFKLPERELLVRGEEDCLTLNIYAPAVAHAPVMVWLHGGSFQMGAGSNYNPRLLAQEQGVVVVTLNYRLGPVGFLTERSLAGERGGNYGFADQQLALKWVRDNVAAFGGDARNVTLFGESAGGMSTCLHLLSPASRGLFDKAIIQSGPCTMSGTVISRAEALLRGGAYSLALGCGVGDVTCLRKVTSDAMIRVPAPGLQLAGMIPFPLSAETDTVPAWPADAFKKGEFAPVPILMGTTANEGTLFTSWLGGNATDLKVDEFATLALALGGHRSARIMTDYRRDKYPTWGQTIAAVATDGLFACPTSDLVRLLGAKTSVYQYEFTDPRPPTNLVPTKAIPDYGAFHGAELASIFGTRYYEDGGDPAHFSPAQAELAQQMRTAWATFAKTGRPSAPGWPEWTPAQGGQPAVLNIAPGATAMRQDFRSRHLCDRVWNAKP